jgi:signal transduction histidine kinase
MYCDFQVYEGIFFHIISNAIKFTTRGSTVSIKVSFVPLSGHDNQNQSEIVIDTSKEPDGESEIMGMLVTQISDQGPGLSQKRLRQM